MAPEQTLELGLERVLAVELAVSVGLVFVIERGLEWLSAQERVSELELERVSELELASELERVSALAWVAASARTPAKPWGCQESPSARAWASASAVGSVDPKERVSAPPWAARTVSRSGPEMVPRWAASSEPR